MHNTEKQVRIAGKSRFASINSFKRVFVVAIQVKICLTAFMLALAGRASGEEPEDIVKLAYILGNDPNIRIKITMTIEEKQGSKNRMLEAYIRRNEKGSDILLHVIEPSFLNKMKFLSHRDASGAESRWLKTSKGVKRLSEANNTERVFGSDFTVEDLSEVQISDFEFKLIETGEMEGETCYIIEAQPLYKNSLYSRKVLMIGTETMLMRKVEFHDKKNNLIKRYRLLETQIINNTPYPLLCTMEDLSKNTCTGLHLTEIEPVKSLPDKIFNKGNL